MAGQEKKGTLKFDQESWHDYMSKITATLPKDVAESVMHAADEAGAEHGTMLLLEILRHLKVGDDEDLADRAREAVKKQD
ncbi:MAG: hypothetical protein AAF942_02890 [Pseudomonadota bacterium]